MWVHDQEVVGSTRARSGNILSWRFDHKIFSTVILSFPLIQEGQLPVSGEQKYYLTAYRSKPAQEKCG